MLRISSKVWVGFFVLLFGGLQVTESLAAAKVEYWVDELPIRQAWLSDHLPDDSLAYVRIPHLFGLLASPKGSAIDAALRSKTNIENIEKIRQGFSDNVLPHIPVFANVQLRLLEEHLRSPIEMAFFLAEAPSVLVSINIDLDSNESLAEMLELMGVPLLEPLDEEGVGQIGVVPIPVFLKFDAESGHLLALGGPAATASEFDAAIASTEQASPLAMSSMEDRIDQSGQGLFVWVDTERGLPMLQAILPPEQAEVLVVSGLSQVTSAATGWGVADGKGRLSFAVDLPEGGEREFLPYVNNEISATAVGEPDGLFVLSIPTVSEFSRMEALALDSADTDSQLSWGDGKDAFQEFSGVTVEEIFEAIGPELLFFFDQAGDYMALRVRDSKLWDKLISRVSKKTGQALETRRIDGIKYFHISTPNELALLSENEAGELGWFAVLLSRQRDHMYWTQEGDYLYIASAPQVLIDRANMAERTDIGHWLRDRQRINIDNAVLSISGTGRKLPKRVYAMYIEVIQMLADISETEIDIWAMPTPRQLQLPDLGTLGFTMNFGDPTLSVELTFENNPLELLGGAGGIAAVGILAAIAIPAYQDYTVRAQISEGLYLSAELKTEISEFYFANQRFPNAEEAAAMSIMDIDSDNIVSVIVEAGSGNIFVQFSDNVADGGELFLLTDADVGGALSWTCSGTFEDKHLPAECRGELPEEYDGGDT
jgi:hypothetical protein